MQTVTNPTTHEGTTTDVTLSNGINLRITAHVPARYSPRAHKLERYRENSWAVTFHLVLAGSSFHGPSAIEDEPIIAQFTDYKNNSKEITTLLGSLGETDIAAPEAILALVRKMRDETVEAAMDWNAAKDAKQAAKDARKELTA